MLLSFTCITSTISKILIYIYYLHLKSRHRKIRHHDGNFKRDTDEKVEKGIELNKRFPKKRTKISKEYSPKQVNFNSKKTFRSDVSSNDQNKTASLHSNPLPDHLSKTDMRRNIPDNKIIERISVNDNGATDLKPSKVATERCIIPPKKNVLHPVLEHNSADLVKSKSTECLKDDNFGKDYSNNTTVQEKCFTDNRKVTVCIVKPLKSPDPEICKKNAGVPCKAKGIYFIDNIKILL